MKSVYGRLIMSYFLSIILALVLCAAITTNKNEKYLKDRNEQNIINTNHFIAELVDNSNSTEQLDDLLNDYHKNSLFDFSVLLSRGFESEYGHTTLILSPKDITRLSHNIGAQVSYTDHNVQSTSISYLSNDGEVVIVTVERNISDEMNNFYSNGLIAVVSVLISGGLIFLIFADLIVKPISRLTKANNELAKGNYNVRVNYYGNDQIAELNRSFNRMASVLDKQEKTRQQFISDVSHEFQTPLTAISGFAKILKEENLPEAQRQKYADIILFQSKRLSTLAKNMLQLTMLDSDNIELNVSEYDLIDQLDRVCETQLSIANSKNIEIEKEFDSEECKINADESRLEQVWTNLINNAIKYTNDNGVVTVGVKKTFTEIEISISDTGVGMSKEALTHVFDRFYREDKSRGVEGNGLGLSIVKRIIDLHNYNISVSSIEDGGSVFKVSIPLARSLINRKKG